MRHLFGSAIVAGVMATLAAASGAAADPPGSGMSSPADLRQATAASSGSRAADLTGSSPDARAARAAARAQARSRVVMDAGLLALLQEDHAADPGTRQKEQLGRQVFRDSNLSQPAGQ